MHGPVNYLFTNIDDNLQSRVYQYLLLSQLYLHYYWHAKPKNLIFTFNKDKLSQISKRIIMKWSQTSIFPFTQMIFSFIGPLLLVLLKPTPSYCKDTTRKIIQLLPVQKYLSQSLKYEHPSFPVPSDGEDAILMAKS